jgi:hypothetical protein
MTDDPSITIQWELQDTSIGGVDTLIAVVPDGYYVTINDEKSLLLVQVIKSVRALIEDQGIKLGEIPHHAEIYFTTNPSVVQAKGSMHDCEACRAGIRRGLRQLKENPDKELMVGIIYWVA